MLHVPLICSRDDSIRCSRLLSDCGSVGNCGCTNGRISSVAYVAVRVRACAVVAAVPTAISIVCGMMFAAV